MLAYMLDSTCHELQIGRGGGTGPDRVAEYEGWNREGAGLKGSCLSAVATVLLTPE